MKKNLLKNDGVQSLIASLICILVGLLIGYIVLLIINPSGAWEAIVEIVRNFFHFSRPALQWKNLGNTLVKATPLLMCSLSVIFGYKAGLFNIGVAGQYVAGGCAGLYAALVLGWGWLPCLLLALAVAAVVGALSGVLKAYCNVNEVISGIMLNWITLYMANMLLSPVQDASTPYTVHLSSGAPQALLPKLPVGDLFTGNKYVTIAIPIAVILAIVVQVIFRRTRLGYELRATGLNKDAAKYSGMGEKKNLILTMAISGALAGLGGAMFYLTDFEQWLCTASTLPGMGFNGIAAAFLGGLDPIGAIFSSYFIQHITSGGAYVDKTLYCTQISDMISSIVIYLCSFVMFIKYVINKSIAKREQKLAAASAKGGEA